MGAFGIVAALAVNSLGRPVGIYHAPDPGRYVYDLRYVNRSLVHGGRPRANAHLTDAKEKKPFSDVAIVYLAKSLNGKQRGRSG